jgi:hypothetical protein
VSGLRRQALSIVVGYVALGGVVGLAFTPVVLGVAPASRPAMIRLAAAIVLGVALIHLRVVAGRRVRSEPPSAFDRALTSEPLSPATDRHFRECLEGVRHGSAREGYWRRVLWPHLCVLAERYHGAALPEPPRSAVRRLFRQGPHLAQIRELVRRLESRA